MLFNNFNRLPSKKRILVAPLDWGLGHATRCVPLILYLLERGAEPVIAAGGRPLSFLKEEFPSLEFIDLPGYAISYPSKGSMVMKMAASAPRIIRGINAEHRALQKIIIDYRIDAVISDNRFGLWTKEVPCIFITHQLMVKAPFGESLLHRLNKSYIKKYDECWIPDNEENDLSGDLSHQYELPSNAHFIGPLSRFEKFTVSNSQKEIKYDLLVLLSGPEPQRSIFEKIVLDQVKNISLKTLIVQGKPGENLKEQKENITIVPHLDSASLLDAVLSSQLILSRPGYSTIMDLSVTGSKAVFVSTPGQTEQEYLGQLMMKRGIVFCVSQQAFNLDKAITESRNYKGFEKDRPGGHYRKRIDALLDRL